MLYDKTILIVEDEPKTRQGIQKTLEQWGKGKYRILTVDNAYEAIDVLENETVHLLLSDIRMPGMSGLQLVRKLRSNPVGFVTILISGHAEFEYAREAIELQVSDYLLKPIEKRKLISAVEQALELEKNRHLQRRMEQIIDRRLIDADASDATSGPVREALAYIRAHYDKQIGLKEAAEHIHMNSSYLSALFKEQLGINFSEYVTRYRIQKAKEFLVSTPLSINEIAERVGYLTAKYFIKLFREQEGMTPSEYRKHLNEQPE